MARNILLDGNAFSDRHSVVHKIFIDNHSAGVAVNIKTNAAYP
ncbi:MAG: hypothetical protein ABI162_17600 [Luteolibacter sp.]